MKSKLLIFCVFAATLFAIDIKDVPSGKRILPNEEGSILSYSVTLERAKEAVVNITAISTSKSSFNSHFDDFFNDPFFEQFFNFKREPGKPHKNTSMGSGVLISSDGYIITNNHVVEGTQEIKVSLQNGKEYEAKLIGTDSKTDLAVIKIDAKNLTPIPFANSDDVKIGDVVFAIGNPFGVGITVTSGIISALNKNNVGLNQYEDFIQTDAAINPGNSGGALVSSAGALIGINSAILSRSGASNGIGFAIPANMAKDISLKLAKDGKIERGFLGVTLANLSKDLKKAYKNQEGALVTDVVPKSSAQEAGIKRGDLIIKVNDKPIKNYNDLKNYIGSLNPDESVVVEFERNGKVESKKIQLKSDTSIATSVKDTQLDGLMLEDNKSGGVRIVGVEPNSSAQKAGFMAQDLIIGIGDIEVANINELNNLLRAMPKNAHVVIWVRRGNINHGILIR